MHKSTNSLTKMTFFAHGVLSKKNLCGVYSYDKWNFEPKISSLFHFGRVNDGWVSHIFCVNNLVLTLIRGKIGPFSYQESFTSRRFWFTKQSNFLSPEILYHHQCMYNVHCTCITCVLKILTLSILIKNEGTSLHDHKLTNWKFNN